MLNFDNTENAFAYRKTAELKKAKWLFGIMASSFLTKLGGIITPKLLWSGVVRGVIKSTIYKQFCGGVDLKDASKTAESLNQYRVGSILDYGVEGKTSEKEFDKAKDAFIETIKFAKEKDYIPFISLKLTGLFRFSLLQKLTAGGSLSEEEKAEKERAFQRLLAICQAGADYHTMILIDAEESWIQQAVDDLADTMMAEFNIGRIVVYNTFQMYRHDRLSFLMQSHEKAQNEGYILGAKLVRGAYMEKERARASEKSYPSPIQPNKEATDHDYDQGVDYCLQHINDIALFVGTHNEKSSMLAAQKMDEIKLAHASDRVYFSQLYGMSDNISFNLAAAGYNVSKYLPYGPVKDVIPYLLRRANENTSVAGQTTRELDLIKKELKRRGAN